MRKDKDMNDSNAPTTISGACSYIEQLSRLYNEEGWRQLTPGLSSMLDRSISVLEKNANINDKINNTLEIALYLKNNMDGITLIKNTLKL